MRCAGGAAVCVDDEEMVVRLSVCGRVSCVNDAVQVVRCGHVRLPSDKLFFDVVPRADTNIFALEEIWHVRDGRSSSGELAQLADVEHVGVRGTFAAVNGVVGVKSIRIIVDFEIADDCVHLAKSCGIVCEERLVGVICFRECERSADFLYLAHNFNSNISALTAMLCRFAQAAMSFCPTPCEQAVAKFVRTPIW